MTRIETLWETIRTEAAKCRIPAGESALVRIDPHHPFDIYAGVEGAGSVMLAIGVSTRPPLIDADTGALSYVRWQRAGNRWIMGLRLTAPGLEQVFGRLCQDLVDTALHVVSEAVLVSLFRERLLLWKRLFMDNGSGLLQRFQIKGLIAELLALEAFIAAHPQDPLLPVVSWRGPCGADQDFLFADHAVEVKAVAPGAATVSIASTEQLEADVPLSLRVCVLREAAPSELGALTLPVLAERIERQLVGAPDAIRLFRDRLLEAGYVEHEHYLSVAFTVMEMRQYAVLEGFPRLVRAHLPDGIQDTIYTILLRSIEAFQISGES